MSDWVEAFLIPLAVLVVFVPCIRPGYSCGTQDMDEPKAEKAVAKYVKPEADLKEATTRRDECRRFVREWTSTLGAKGLFKKVFVLFLVALCHGLGTMSPN